MQLKSLALARRRIELGLTQAELAERAGVNRSTIGLLENGQGVRLGTVRKLAKALDVEIADLVEFPELPELETQAS